jgi:hypothetical protein
MKYWRFQLSGRKQRAFVNDHYKSTKKGGKRKKRRKRKGSKKTGRRGAPYIVRTRTRLSGQVDSHRFQLLRRGIFLPFLGGGGGGRRRGGEGGERSTRTYTGFLGRRGTPCERALKISIAAIDASAASAAPLSILACIDRCHRNFRIACHITCHLSLPA